MASWLVGLMISKSIHRNFGVTAVFRFYLIYVNYPFSILFLDCDTKASILEDRRD